MPCLAQCYANLYIKKKETVVTNRDVGILSESRISFLAKDPEGGFRGDRLREAGGRRKDGMEHKKGQRGGGGGRAVLTDLTKNSLTNSVS